MEDIYCGVLVLSENCTLAITMTLTFLYFSSSSSYIFPLTFDIYPVFTG